MKCLICGCDTVKYDLEVEFIYVCKSCGYGRPTLQDSIIYTDEYEMKYLEYHEDAINKIRISFLNSVLNYYGASENSSILDYGCGSGSFVRTLRNTGWHAFGYDINDFTSDLRPCKDYKPKIITAWDSFEHLNDNQQKEFFDLAKTAKVICISLPDFSSADKENIYSWRHYRPREHLNYYTFKSLCIRFAHEGFKVAYSSHEEDLVRSAPWENNILSVGFIK